MIKFVPSIAPSINLVKFTYPPTLKSSLRHSIGKLKICGLRVIYFAPRAIRGSDVDSGLTIVMLIGCGSSSMMCSIERILG